MDPYRDLNVIPDSLAGPLVVSVLLWAAAMASLFAALLPPERSSYAIRHQRMRYVWLAGAGVASVTSLVFPFVGHQDSVVFYTLRTLWGELGLFGWALNIGFFGSLVTLLAVIPTAIYVQRHPVERLHFYRNGDFDRYFDDVHADFDRYMDGVYADLAARLRLAV